MATMRGAASLASQHLCAGSGLQLPGVGGPCGDSGLGTPTLSLLTRTHTHTELRGASLRTWLVKEMAAGLQESM